MELIKNNDLQITSRRRNLLLLVIIVLASLPLFRVLIHPGHDLDFHLNRILSLSDSIINNPQFPHRIASDLLLGYGYASPIYYPELFLYIPALINVFISLSFPRYQELGLIFSYQAFVLIINIATTVISYKCFSKISSSDKGGLLAAALFVLCPYRWICIYTRAAVGEFTALTFLPLVAYSFYSIYFNKQSTWYINSIILGIGFSGILQSHIITCCYTTIFVLLIALAFFKHTFCKKTMITILLSVVIVLFLNLWFIVPFIDYMLSFDAQFNHGVSLGGSVQQHGIYLSQLVDFFGDMDGTSTFGKENISSRFQMSPGIISITAILFSVVLWVRGQLNKAEKIITSFTLIIIFMSTVFFPWDTFILLPGIGSIMGSIQFPWRLLGFISLLSSIMTCFLFKRHLEKTMKIYCFYIGFGVISLFSIFHSIWSFNNMSFSGDVTDLPISTCRVGGAEYLPYGAHDCNLNNALIVSKTGTVTVFQVLDEDIPFADLPIYYYPGYQAYNSSGEKLPTMSNSNKCVRVIVPKNTSGLITVTYEVPLLWRISEIISLCAMIGLIIFIRKFQKKDATS